MVKKYTYGSPFYTGAVVFHKAFGSGMICTVEKGVARIDFGKNGRKNIDISVAVNSGFMQILD